MIYHSQLHFVSCCLRVLASAAIFTENTLRITQGYSGFLCIYKFVVTDLFSTKSWSFSDPRATVHLEFLFVYRRVSLSLTVHLRWYVEINRPTRCNRWFFTAKPTVRSACFGHHYAHHQELKSIIQVVAACGTWCFGLQVVGLVWNCRLCVRFAGCCSIRPTTCKPKHQVPQAATTCIILLSSWWWA